MLLINYLFSIELLMLKFDLNWNNYDTSERTINQMEAFDNQKRTPKVFRNYSKQKKKMIASKKQEARIKANIFSGNLRVLDKEAIVKMIQNQKAVKKRLDLQNKVIQEQIERSKTINRGKAIGQQNQRQNRCSDMLRDNIFLKSVRNRYEELKIKYQQLLSSVQSTKKSKKYTRYRQAEAQKEICLQEFKRLKGMHRMYTLAYKESKRVNFERIMRQNDVQLLEYQIKQNVKDRNQELIDSIEQLQSQVQSKKANKLMLAQQKNKLIREIQQYKERLYINNTHVYHKKYGKQLQISGQYGYQIDPFNMHGMTKSQREPQDTPKQSSQQDHLSMTAWKQQPSSTTSIYRKIKANNFSNECLKSRKSVPQIRGNSRKYTNQEFQGFEKCQQRSGEYEEEQFDKIDEEDGRLNQIYSKGDQERQYNDDQYEEFLY